MRNFSRNPSEKNHFFAVIHVQNESQMLRNVDIARRNGADGVFLINHDIDTKQLLRCYEVARKHHPSYWIGLNILNVSAIGAHRLIPIDADALWCDNAGINEQEGPEKATKFNEVNSSWQGDYFGGVAFKYQTKVNDLETIARRAVPFVDVITTSGDATGSPPALEKIIAMRKGAGNHPIAIASGMTPENVIPFLPLVNCFLVATGISDSHTELNPTKTLEFANRMNS